MLHKLRILAGLFPSLITLKETDLLDGGLQANMLPLYRAICAIHLSLSFDENTLVSKSESFSIQLSNYLLALDDFFKVHSSVSIACAGFYIDVLIYHIDLLCRAFVDSRERHEVSLEPALRLIIHVCVCFQKLMNSKADLIISFLYNWATTLTQLIVLSLPKTDSSVSPANRSTLDQRNALMEQIRFLIIESHAFRRRYSKHIGSIDELDPDSPADSLLIGFWEEDDNVQRQLLFDMTGEYLPDQSKARLSLIDSKLAKPSFVS